MRGIFFLLLVILINTVGFSQLVLVPVERVPSLKNTPAARTHDTALTLPFWDDFSATRNGYADPNRWQHSQSVWVNDGMGVNAPSLNVATFDGLDSLGKPYNINDVLAKGFADKLVSLPIQLDQVPTTDRAGVALSFFYQFRGNGESPDPGDLLTLAFKNVNGQWDPIWSIENTGTLQPDKFIRVIIPITGDQYFHDSFQFRFQNFARLSGPYDTWHVDYVYISNGKTQTAPVFPLFPDRAITGTFTSLFKDYRSMPVEHFFTNPTQHLIAPKVTITNLRQDQLAGNGQPVSYSTQAVITQNKEGLPETVLTPTLDVNVNIGSELTFAEQKVVSLQTLPDPATLDASADSIHINLKIQFDTGDDKIKTPTEGDYDFDVFNPIKFNTNDSTRASFILADYYAYDDGTAEYGAGLNQPGAELAYEFNLPTSQPDTIVAIEMYFPRFGDESNQIIQLKIYRELTGSPFDVIYQGSIPIQRNSQNKFWRIPLPEPVGVRNKFYVGWKQQSSAVIAVGLDKNTDSGSKIFSNINAAWVQNTTLKGSLMIRPVFGPGKQVITPIQEKPVIGVYPNPGAGIFYLSSPADQIQVVDFTGREIPIEIERNSEQTRITVTQATRGIYILRTFHSGLWTTTKLLIER